jgi:hypothetical protein
MLALGVDIDGEVKKYRRRMEVLGRKVEWSHTFVEKKDASAG